MARFPNMPLDGERFYVAYIDAIEEIKNLTESDAVTDRTSAPKWEELSHVHRTAWCMAAQRIIDSVEDEVVYDNMIRMELERRNKLQKEGVSVRMDKNRRLILRKLRGDETISIE